ncbi:MAG: helix-turn-helix domain-containing protein [Aestuariivirga sp.]|uniref:helix-turn-helix domain-containing protein n=1 Tax=Aestuariivirga sp. TaxID=2650926 RepID=UPI0038D10081
MRARIVLASARGAQSKDIAVELGVCASTKGKWRRRFAAPGFDGLYGEPRSGKPAALMARALNR